MIDSGNIPNDADDAIFDESFLAKRWKVTEKKLQADRWKGVGVPYLKIGRLVRYRLSDIRAYEAKHLQKVRDE